MRAGPKQPAPGPGCSTSTWPAADSSRSSELSDDATVQGLGRVPTLACAHRRPPHRTLDTIGQACKQLRMLDVAMCPHISMAAVRHLRAQLPQVTCIQSRYVGGADLTLTL